MMNAFKINNQDIRKAPIINQNINHFTGFNEGGKDPYIIFTAIEHKIENLSFIPFLVTHSPCHQVWHYYDQLICNRFAQHFSLSSIRAVLVLENLPLMALEYLLMHLLFFFQNRKTLIVKSYCLTQ